MIHVRKGALARRITVVHGPALDLLVKAPDQFSSRQAAHLSIVSWILDKNVFTLCDDGLVKTLPLR